MVNGLTDAGIYQVLIKQNRVVGWIHLERDSSKNSVMFYAKTPICRQLTENLSMAFPRHGQLPASHLGAAHDEEMCRLVDDNIEKLILGGMEGC